MTVLAQRVMETPLAPYFGLLQALSREEKRIVVLFLMEALEEPKSVRQVPDSFKKLRGMVSITDDEIAQDEHLAHIMER